MAGLIGADQGTRSAMKLVTQAVRAGGTYVELVLMMLMTAILIGISRRGGQDDWSTYEY